MSNDFWSSDQYDQKAQRLYDEGDYDGALELLKEGLTLYPSSAGLHVSMGYAHLAREEYLWARRSFERARVLEPDHEEALLGLGDTLLKFGERSRALRCYERVIELGFADDCDLMLSAGRGLYREGLYGQAERYFRLAVDADSESSDAAAELAYTLHAREEVEEARHWLEEALRQDASHHEARVFYGHLLYESGRYESALEQLRLIPVGEIWDSLAVWRVIELLRGYEGHGPESAELEPYLRRMEQLNPEPTPEDRLLAEVEASAAAGDLPVLPGDENQLELFVPEHRTEEQGGGEHRVRTVDGRVFEGTWSEIVKRMRDASVNPEVPVREFMEEFARRVANVAGIRLPTGEPEAFLRSAAEVGMLEIER